jgi:hypothetical protein
MGASSQSGHATRTHITPWVRPANEGTPRQHQHTCDSSSSRHAKNLVLAKKLGVSWLSSVVSSVLPYSPPSD